MRFFLTALMMSVMASTAFAGQVNLRYDDVKYAKTVHFTDGQNEKHVWTGIMQFTDINDEYQDIDTLYGFCVDFEDEITPGVRTFDEMNSLSELPQISDDEAVVLNKLWDAYHSFAETGINMNDSALEFTGGSSTNSVAAAMQLAFWEVIYEEAGAYNLSLNEGNAYVTRSTEASLATDANLLLDKLSSFDDTFNEDDLNALDGRSYNNQDFAVMLGTDGGSPPVGGIVPLPPSMAMTLMGLVGIGGFGWLKRR